MLFPAAALPAKLVQLDTATPQAVDVQVAYVYLLRVLVGGLPPSANIPLVSLPAAEPAKALELAEPTPQAVEEQVA